MNGGSNILQETCEYQEIINTVVGSKVYYLFQVEIIDSLIDPSRINDANRIALDEALQFLWGSYQGDFRLIELSSKILDKGISSIWDNVIAKFIKEGLTIPSFIWCGKDFKEFLKILKEKRF